MEFLKNILSEKTYKTLTEKLGEELVKSINEKTQDFKIDVAEEKFIPKTKFDEVNNQLKDYKTQIEERDNQLKELADKAKGNENLEKKIQELQAQNEKTRTELEAKLSAREKEFAIKEGLRNPELKIKYPDLVYKVLDLEKVEIKDGQVVGLKEQVEPLKETYKDLFDTDDVPGSLGKDPKNRGKQETLEDKFAKFRRM